MSIISTVIGIVILLIRKVARRKLSPSANYIIWLVFIMILIFPISLPSRISIYNYVNVEDIKYDDSDSINYILNNSKNATPSTKILFNQNNELIPIIGLKTIISFIWFGITIYRLGKKGLAYLFVIREIGDYEIEDEKINLILERCKKALKIKRKVRIINQYIYKTPATIGVFDIRILITDKFLELDDDAMTDVFMHELSHYKRKDNVMNGILIFLKELHWFNPIINIIFKNIRDDMEFATDEMATSKMNVRERQNYCLSMLKVSVMNSMDQKELVLGMSDGLKEVRKRIHIISLQRKFKENTKLITLITILLMMIMIFTLYPSSYGMFQTPILYLELENGENIKIDKVYEENYSGLKEIYVTKNSKINLLTKGGNVNDYIYYSKTDIRDLNNINIVNGTNEEIVCYEAGEYIFKFTLTYGNEQNINYAIKIIVE